MTNTLDRSFSDNFKYTHDNPYHDKLSEFDHFVLRDEEGEAFKARWNSEIFKREAPLCVEIGTGFGDFMMEYSSRYETHNFVGLDYRFKRSFHVAKRLAKHIEDGKNPHFRYLRAKGERLSFLFNENEVDNLFYFFPDPWPKKRHNKKRLFQQPFLEAATKVVKPNGKIWVKTDHDGYGEWMVEELLKFDSGKSPIKLKVEMQTKDLYSEFPEHFLAGFQTKFEKIFLSQGTLIKAFELTVIK